MDKKEKKAKLAKKMKKLNKKMMKLQHKTARLQKKMKTAGMKGAKVNRSDNPLGQPES
jgi:outer membrane murein-binding lipoprotein Lpp